MFDHGETSALTEAELNELSGRTLINIAIEFIVRVLANLTGLFQKPI